MLKLWNFQLVNSHQAEMKSLHHRPAAEYQSGTSQCSREEVFLNPCVLRGSDVNPSLQQIHKSREKSS